MRLLYCRFKIFKRPEVIAASRMLGIDPYTVANEGKAVIGVNSDKAQEVLDALHTTREGKDARIIGDVIDKYNGKVILNTIVGGKRIMEPPVGDPIPRVC